MGRAPPRAVKPAAAHATGGRARAMPLYRSGKLFSVSKVPPASELMAERDSRTCRPRSSATATPMPATSRATRQRERFTAFTRACTSSAARPRANRGDTARWTTAETITPARRADSADVQPQRGDEEQEVDRQAGQVQERALGRDDLHRPHGQRQQEAQVAGIVQHGEGQGDRGEEDESPAPQQGVEHHHLGVSRREPRGQEAPVHAHEHDSVGSQGRERAQGGDGQHPELLLARELAKPVSREPRRSPQGGLSESECRHPSSPGRASRGSRSPLPPSGAAPPAGPRRSAPRG